TVPVLIPLAALCVSLFLGYGAFHLAAREVLVGGAHPYRFDTSRGIEVNLRMRSLGRAWRWWHVLGWWVVAAAAGATVVTVTGALLRGVHVDWLAWALIFLATWMILKVEELLTSWPYRERPERPTPAQAAARMREWRSEHPYDTSGMPWIYG